MPCFMFVQDLRKHTHAIFDHIPRDTKLKKNENFQGRGGGGGGAKIRKISILCKPQFFYIKVGLKGIYISRTCFLDKILMCNRPWLLTCQSHPLFTFDEALFS